MTPDAGSTRRSGGRWLVGGGLLAVISGLYLANLGLDAYQTTTVRTTLQRNEERFDHALDTETKTRESLNNLEQRAIALRPALNQVPDMRMRIDGINRDVTTLESQLKELQKTRDDFQRVLDAMKKAEDMALEGTPVPASTLERDVPELATVTDWNRAKPLVDQLQALTTQQLAIRTKLQQINADSDNPSVDKTALQQQKDAISSELSKATDELNALKRQYTALENDVMNQRDRTAAEISKTEQRLAQLRSQMAEIEKSIDDIQNKLNSVTDQIISVDAIEKASAAVTERINQLTPQIKSLDDDVSKQVRSFIEQSRKLSDDLDTRRATILQNVKWHMTFLAIGVLGCWLLHWGLYKRKEGYYRRKSAQDEPMSPLVIATVLLPEQFRRVTTVGLPPKAVNWFLVSIWGFYVACIGVAFALG